MKLDFITGSLYFDRYFMYIFGDETKENDLIYYVKTDVKYHDLQRQKLRRQMYLQENTCTKIHSFKKKSKYNSC